MTKRLIDVDDRLLQEARRALATDTYKDTVNRAVGQQPTKEDTADVIQAFADATMAWPIRKS